MYLFGGCHDKYESIGDCFELDLGDFLVSHDLNDIVWKAMEVSDKQLLERWGHVSALIEDKAYIFGGRNHNQDIQNIVELNLVTGYCR